MKKIALALGKNSYPIVVGEGAIRAVAKWKIPPDFRANSRTKSRGTKRAFIISDAALRAQRAALKKALKSAGWEVYEYPVRATEAFKELSGIYPIYGKLLSDKADRHSVIFALGGGVIGDAAGFIAATYLRGVKWVGIPTTLLAQVDSALGGKTGVNHKLGKNLIGAFHQPALVVSDVSFLKSLSARDRVSGLGEIVKYGLILDSGFYSFLEKNWKKILDLNPGLTEKTVLRCSQFKARAVSRDERDMTGIREVLNFGHTLGHVFETITGYKKFRHGEAILLGMRAAAWISYRRGHLRLSDAQRIDRFLAAIPLPKLPQMKLSRVLEIMKRDKKMREGKVRFVLLKGIGKTVLDRGVEAREIEFALKKLQSS